MLVEDGQGGFKPTEWVEYFRFYGDVKWGKGSEKVVAGQVQAITYCKIMTYFDQRLDTTMRLLFNGNTLNIRDVSDIEERHQFMDISAELGAGT